MNRRFTWITVLAALVTASVVAPAFADLSQNLGALSGDNAKGYLGPLPKALSGTLNSALFQTGSIPKAGFTFTVGVKVMGVNFADDDKSYSPSDPTGFTSLAPVQAPTVIGDGKAVAQDGVGGTTLYHPGGFDISSFTIAAPQLTIGSAMGTQAVVRWIAVDLGDSDLGKIELFGIGGQHSISQYFPGMPVDLAAGLFYQTFKIGDELLDTKAFHADVTGSKSFGAGMVKLQPYASVGFDTFKMDVSYASSTDPGSKIDVSMDDESGMHFGIGALATLAFVKLHLEFDAGAATGAAMGLSFGK